MRWVWAAVPDCGGDSGADCGAGGECGYLSWKTSIGVRLDSGGAPAAARLCSRDSSVRPPFLCRNVTPRRLAPGTWGRSLRPRSCRHSAAYGRDLRDLTGQQPPSIMRSLFLGGAISGRLMRIQQGSCVSPWIWCGWICEAVAAKRLSKPINAPKARLW